MSKQTEALKLAEDALKRVRTQDMELVQLSMIALAAIREALAEQPAPMIRGDIRDGLVDDEPAQQEPVAWMRHDGTRCCPDEYRKDYPDYETRYPTPLYAHPAAQGSPVAWMVYAKDGLSVYVTDNPTGISEGQRALPLYTSPPAQRKPLTDEQREKLRDAFAQALTSVYVCGRVWDAWQYSTMSEDDFKPASECNELLDGLIEAAHDIKGDA